jgi:hypothetical protein
LKNTRGKVIAFSPVSEGERQAEIYLLIRASFLAKLDWFFTGVYTVWKVEPNVEAHMIKVGSIVWSSSELSHCRGSVNHSRRRILFWL